jgi:hypothetical protein
MEFNACRFSYTTLSIPVFVPLPTVSVIHARELADALHAVKPVPEDGGAILERGCAIPNHATSLPIPINGAHLARPTG